MPGRNANDRGPAPRDAAGPVDVLKRATSAALRAVAGKPGLEVSYGA
ncbi:MAG: hypothetical protein HQL38_09935, partial [Alphaproteobacteria bacterium]|nr:hypothetical protein [Alphaproteobacteria bacterium]